MSVVETREVVEVPPPHAVTVLVEEARLRARRRRLRLAFVVILALATPLALGNYGARRIGGAVATDHQGPGNSSLATSSQDAVTSPYPLTLQMTPGLLFATATRAPAWGTSLGAAQNRWVKVVSTGPTWRWGVWRPNGVAPLYPVRRASATSPWTAAGPALASDWVGGGIYYVTRVIGESRSSALFVSNAVIDLTTDAGHHWFQYVNPEDIWSMTRYNLSGRPGLRVGPDQWATRPPRRSYALYVLQAEEHRWHRVSQFLG